MFLLFLRLRHASTNCLVNYEIFLNIPDTKISFVLPLLFSEDFFLYKNKPVTEQLAKMLRGFAW
jgi:hypothetical protein